MRREGQRPFVYQSKYWWIMGVFAFVLFLILYQYPVIGYFNQRPGQVLTYILCLNALYIVATAVIVYLLGAFSRKQGGAE